MQSSEEKNASFKLWTLKGPWDKVEVIETSVKAKMKVNNVGTFERVCWQSQLKEEEEKKCLLQMDEDSSLDLNVFHASQKSPKSVLKKSGGVCKGLIYM